MQGSKSQRPSRPASRRRISITAAGILIILLIGSAMTVSLLFWGGSDLEQYLWMQQQSSDHQKQSISITSCVTKQQQQIASSSANKNTNNSSTDYKDSKWCPYATCHNSHMCIPCRRRFLIVIASGRSASTTLTYMLDMLPGLRMAGENNDALKAIRFMMEHTRSYPMFTKYVNTRSAWGHNEAPKGAYACVGQSMVETMNPPPPPETAMNSSLDNTSLVERTTTDYDDSNTIVGFKTIRFHLHLQDNDVTNMVEWVKEIFPCTRIIVNIRSNVTAQQAAFKQSFGENMSTAELEEWNDKFIHVYNSFGTDMAYLLDSSQWVHNVTQLNELVQWLGFDGEKCVFTELLKFNTRGGISRGQGEADKMPPECNYVS